MLVLSLFMDLGLDWTDDESLKDILLNDKGIKPLKRIIPQVIKALTNDEVKVQLYILDSDFEFKGMSDSNLRKELSSRVKILINEAKKLSIASTTTSKSEKPNTVTPHGSPVKGRSEIIFD